jgi:hypothetical protein
MSSTLQEGLMWRCTGCGERNFNHYENCVSCGRARPPPRDGAFSDTLRSEPALTKSELITEVRAANAHLRLTAYSS